MESKSVQADGAETQLDSAKALQIETKSASAQVEFVDINKESTKFKDKNLEEIYKIKH